MLNTFEIVLVRASSSAAADLRSKRLGRRFDSSQRERRGNSETKSYYDTFISNIPFVRNAETLGKPLADPKIGARLK